MRGNWEPSFTVKGFTNWKDATTVYKKHKDIDVNKEAVEKLYVLPKTTKDICESLSQAHAREKKQNLQYLLKVLQSIHFFARQGIFLHGNEFHSASKTES